MTEEGRRYRDRGQREWKPGEQTGVPGGGPWQEAYRAGSSDRLGPLRQQDWLAHRPSVPG